LYFCTKQTVMNSWQEYIVINQDIRFGKPTIIGTRICVGDILNWLASGMSNESILEDFPELSNDSILAALSFAANREQITKILAV
jgi:uncharacterized protein (DUF433 family)